MGSFFKDELTIDQQAKAAFKVESNISGPAKEGGSFLNLNQAYTG